MLSDALVGQLMAFRTERDWEQFHTPKNLAIAISVEAGELLEQFQWTAEAETNSMGTEQQLRIADEIADITILLTYLTHDLGIDLQYAVADKLACNALR